MARTRGACGPPDAGHPTRPHPMTIHAGVAGACARPRCGARAPPPIIQMARPCTSPLPAVCKGARARAGQPIRRRLAAAGTSGTTSPDSISNSPALLATPPTLNTSLLPASRQSDIILGALFAFLSPVCFFSSSPTSYARLSCFLLRAYGSFSRMSIQLSLLPLLLTFCGSPACSCSLAHCSLSSFFSVPG